jgi:hypothetical protein
MNCLIKEIITVNVMGNPTLTPTMLTKEEILNYHRSVLCSLDILGSSLNPDFSPFASVLKY